MAYAYVQSANHSADASADHIPASSSLSFPSNIGSGQRLIVVQVCFGGGSNLVTGIADTLGTTYTLAQFQAGLNVSGAIYYGLAPSGGGANAVQVTLSAAAAFRRLAIHEYSGNATASVLDQVNSAAHDSTPPANAPDSGNVTTTADGELIFGCWHMDQGGDVTVTAGSGFTKREDYQHANAPASTEDKVQTSAGTTKADFALSGDVRWVCLVATFKAAAGAGDEDVIIRYGSLSLADGSGLITAAFQTDAVAGTAGAGMYLWYYQNVVEDLV